MTEPKAVTRARRWSKYRFAVRDTAVEILSAVLADLLAAYDELARVEAERFLTLVDVTNRCMAAIKEHDELAASVREREAASWGRGFTAAVEFERGWSHAVNNGEAVPCKPDNPYEGGKTTDG